MVHPTEWPFCADVGTHGSSFGAAAAGGAGAGGLACRGSCAVAVWVLLLGAASSGKDILRCAALRSLRGRAGWPGRPRFGPAGNARPCCDGSFDGVSPLATMRDVTVAPLRCCVSLVIGSTGSGSLGSPGGRISCPESREYMCAAEADVRCVPSFLSRKR